MLVPVYVNWYNEELLTKSEYTERLNEKTEEIRTDNIAFNEWLCECYDASDIWDMTDEKRQRIEREWVDRCMSDADDELGFSELTIEV